MPPLFRPRFMLLSIELLVVMVKVLRVHDKGEEDELDRGFGSRRLGRVRN